MRHRKHPARRGAALVVSLVVLAVSGAIGLSLLRIAVLRHDHLQQIQRREQADWLLASGLSRAQARLAADPQYREETWQPEPGDGFLPAVVSIRVEHVEEKPSQRTIHVVAQYGPPGKTVQRSQHITIETSTGE